MTDGTTTKDDNGDDDKARIVPVECGRGNHDWSDEPLDDGSYFCENPGCAMFLFPKLGAVAPHREAAEAFAEANQDANGG